MHKFQLLVILLLGFIAIEEWPSFHASLSAPITDVLTFLLVILALVGATSFLLHELNRREIEEYKKEIRSEIERISSDERLAGNINSYLANATSLTSSHLITYDESDKIKKAFQDHKESKFVKRGVAFGKMAREALHGISDPGKYSRLFFNAHNNLAFAITISFFPTAEEKKMANEFSKKAIEFSQSMTPSGDSSRYVAAATRALVQLRFGKPQEAEEIYNQLLSEDRLSNSCLFEVPDEDRKIIQENKEFVEKILKYGEKT